MSLDIFDVSGQKALLTGTGRGIGKGIALAFAQAGADVAVTGLTPTGVNKVAEEVRALGRVCLPLTGDATTAADTDALRSKSGSNAWGNMTGNPTALLHIAADE